MPPGHEGDGDSERKAKEEGSGKRQSGQVPLVPTPAPFLNDTIP